MGIPARGPIVVTILFFVTWLDPTPQGSMCMCVDTQLLNLSSIHILFLKNIAFGHPTG